MKIHLVSIVSAAAVACLAAVSLAGDAVRLSIELPKDAATVEAGDPGVDVVIVGIDAAGQRVGPGDRTIEVSATEGDLTLVEKPYKYRYLAPATVAQASLPVKLSAWLKQAPDVRGEAALTLLPRRPYERLLIAAPATTVELGKSMELEVRGVRADGTSALVKDMQIEAAVDGVGTLAALTPGMYRYAAPGKGETKMAGATAHLRAWLTRYPKVAGELSIVVTAEAPPPPAAGGPLPPVNPPPQPPTAPPATGGTKPADSDDDDSGGVLWPSGNVKLLVWRTKASRSDSNWSKKRTDLPPAGKPLIASQPLFHLRIEIERADVRKVELESYVGDKTGAVVHVDDADKSGALHLEKIKNGKTHAILEFTVPEGKPLILNLLLTTAKGEVIKEEFVAQRGRDGDNDGQKDGGKKK